MVDRILITRTVSGTPRQCSYLEGLLYAPPVDEIEWILENGFGIRESHISDLQGALADIAADKARTPEQRAADDRRAALARAKAEDDARQAIEKERRKALQAARDARLQELARQRILDEINAAAARTATRIERAKRNG